MGSDIRNTACRFAWDYPVLNLAGNRIRNCCRAGAHPVSRTDIERLGTNLFNRFEPLVDVRLSLLRGERTDACSSCWVLEDKGMISPRTNLDGLATYIKRTNYFPGKSTKEIEELLLNLTPDQEQEIARLKSPRMLEISLGNTCDLKCVYCNYHYSSQWAAEALLHNEVDPKYLERDLPKIYSEYEDVFWEWFESYSSTRLDNINFIGGEPLIIPRYYEYMDRMIALYKDQDLEREVSFSVVTNLNTPDKLLDKFINILDEFFTANDKLIFEISVSMESMSNRAEFIRTGTVWSTLESNLLRLLEYKKNRSLGDRLNIVLIPTINALSISDSYRFYDWVTELATRPGYHMGLRQNQIVWPAWNSVLVLPVEFASYLDDSITVIKDRLPAYRDKELGRDWLSYITFLEGIRTGIRSPTKDRLNQREFAKQIDKLCHRRGLDFAATFPEMVDFYNMCKAL